MRSQQICFGLILLVALTNGIPAERKARMTRPDDRAPMVVDVPAGMFDGDDEMSMSSEPKLTKVPLEAQQSEVEFLPPSKMAQDSAESTEDGAVVPDVKNKDTDADTSIFGLRVPTIFVIRRPVFRDPFPLFTPFQNFRPFSGFGERRPVMPDSSSDSDERIDTVNQMEGMLKRMQQQMSSLWGSFLSPTYQRPFRPAFPSFESAETDSNNSSETSVLNIDKLPANYSNSTSETKVVDGRVVQVNRTIHKVSSGDNSHGFFSFQVINVRPTEGPSTPETPQESGEGQPIVPADTEVKPEGTQTVEVEQSSTPSTTTVKPEDPTLNEVGADDKDKEIFPYAVSDFDLDQQVRQEEDGPDYEFIPHQREIRPRSLSGDLRVNKLMEEQRLRAPYLMINPDVEYVDI